MNGSSATIFMAGTAAGATIATLCACAVKRKSSSTEPDSVGDEEEGSLWRVHPPKVEGGELWRTKSLGGFSLQEIMDCESAPLRAGQAAADPDNFWSSAAVRAALLAEAPLCQPKLSGGGLVRFELNGQPLTQRGFLQMFAQPSLVSGGDVQQTRVAWAPAVAAARAFRMAVLQSCGDSSGSVYWKGPGFALSSLDDEFVALCCGTVAPLSSRGDGAKFTVNPGTVRISMRHCVFHELVRLSCIYLDCFATAIARTEGRKD